jgi:hypothetical protein
MKHTGNDNLASGDVDGQPPVIEMLNVDGTTGKRGQQVDLGLVEQVVTLALETGVRLLLDLEDNITRHNTGHLVTLAAELDLVAVAHTLVDVNVQHLALHDGLLTVALLATVLVADDLALTVTVGADGLEALDHGTHLAHHGLHTATVAACALLDGALLTSAAITAGTDDGLLERQFRHLAAVNVLQVDLVHMVDGTGLLRASIAHATTEHAAEAAAAAAEELREEVLGVHATSTAGAALQTLLAILVVDATLLVIGQDFVGVRQLLELLGSLGVVGVLVYTEQTGVSENDGRRWESEMGHVPG